jgi:AcrR family transcriptional regulator
VASTRRTPLTIDVIVDAACELIAESHADELTMRRLSERLGVALGATYHHVPDRETLLALVVARIHRSIPLRSTHPAEWATTLRWLMIDYAEAYARYPGMATFSNTHPQATPIDETQRGLVTLLGAAGFAEDSVVNVLAAFFFMMSGATSSDLLYRRSPGAPDAILTRRFRESLELLIEGSRLRLRADRRARRAPDDPSHG